MGENETSIVIANDFSLLEVLSGGGTISDQMLKRAAKDAVVGEVSLRRPPLGRVLESFTRS